MSRASRQSNRLAANKHSSTEPDVTAVRVISIKLPTAVETTGIVGRSDFGLGFLAAMVVLGAPSHAGSMKRLSGVVNQTLPNRDGLQIYAIAFPWRGRAFYLPSQRHGTHSETCRSLVRMSVLRAKAEVARTLPNCRE